ncbi:MAG: TonB family protein [Puniceicoccales bacterium]
MSKRTTTRGFWVSITVHVLFFGAILLMIAWKRMHKPEVPVIFELVEPPSEQQMETPSEPVTEPEPQPEEPLIDAPQIAPSEPVDIPDLNIPEPEPEPEPTPPPPEPKPTPTPKPKSEPKPTPKPTTPTMTAAEFNKKFGKPSQAKPKPVKPAATPTLRVSQPVVRSNTSAGSSNPADQRALESFIARLRRQIELAWDKPESLEGTEVYAVVNVTVQPNGSLNPVVLVTPSGSQIFDSSILTAVRRARNIGGAPSGQAVTVSYTFRMIER